MPDVHHQPVEHVKVEVVGEVLRNPFPLRLFEPSKPSRAEFLVPAIFGQNMWGGTCARLRLW